MFGIRLSILALVFSRLEEQVAIINYISLLIKFLNENTSCLKSLHLKLLLNCLCIELSTLTLRLLENLEEEGTTITLYQSLAEVTLLGRSNGTCESRLARTCSLYEDRSTEGNLID